MLGTHSLHWRQCVTGLEILAGTGLDYDVPFKSLLLTN